ncbi:hypothetical protein [Enterococcus sp. LJL51]|uniref:hypothetical protein n=1 Tax=Enterococcus sp. LJL51 TaxID=3416656 RepID=UPI003CE7783F
MNYFLYMLVILVTHYIAENYLKKMTVSFMKLLGLIFFILLALAIISTVIHSIVPIILGTLISAVLLQTVYLKRTVLKK